MAQTRLIIPIGDPTGIGPEVTLKALSDEALIQHTPITLVGSRDVLAKTGAQLGLRNVLDRFPLIDLPLEPTPTGAGEASFRYLETAIAQTLAGQFDGIVTGPIAKSAWKAAGHHYPGQTEVLALKAQADRFGMFFAGRSPHTDWTLRCLLATVHIPLAQVPQTLTPELLTQKLELLLDSLRQDFGLTHPHIAIAGLNPHSGELGQLGTEEVEQLQPWLETMRSRYPQIKLEGLVPPDTLWVKSGQAWFQDASVGAADAYLAMYHDQGLIPVKLMAFDRAVNVTVGLPFVRTSPDHGTAFDIAGQGIANPQSMKSAIEWAICLVQNRCRGTSHVPTRD
jgi:4-hydroxythreonine-4-phosphate dehydrogenase